MPPTQTAPVADPLASVKPGQSLTPEQVNAARTKVGLPQVSAAPAGQAANPWAKYDETMAAKKQQATPVVQPTVGEQAGKNIATQWSEAGKKIGSSITEGAAKFVAEPTDGSIGTELKRTGDLLETGLGAAAGAAQGVFAPITGAIQTAMERSGAKLNAADNSPAKKAIDALHSFAEAHPEAAKNIMDVITVGTAELGGKAATGVITKEGAASAVADTAKTVKQGVTEGIQAVKGTGAKVADKAQEIGGNRSLAKTIEQVQGTEDTMTKGERLSALDEGRVKPTKLGGKTYEAASIERRAAGILDGKLSSNPVKNIEPIKKEIAIRGKEVEDYLKENSKPITAAEQSKMFSDKRALAEKSLTESELNAYDEQVKMFSKQLVGRGGFNTSNFYKALKDYESNVADKLPRGKAALLDPTGVASAKLHAASDVRDVVRDMLASKHTDFKQKMFDLASLYKAKSTVLTKADQLEGNVITRGAKALKEHPVVAGIAGYELAKHTLVPELPGI